MWSRPESCQVGRGGRGVGDIAAIDRVDALYIGPADLGRGLGGEPARDVGKVFDGTDPNGATLGEAFESVVAAASANGIAPGLHCGDGASTAQAVVAGFTLTSVAVDLRLIASRLSHELEADRGRRAVKCRGLRSVRGQYPSVSRVSSSIGRAAGF
ncbi:MAG: aldolase/citrate lyase family protein [Acidimicrobiia bacterium]